MYTLAAATLLPPVAAARAEDWREPAGIVEPESFAETVPPVWSDPNPESGENVLPDSYPQDGENGLTDQYPQDGQNLLPDQYTQDGQNLLPDQYPQYGETILPEPYPPAGENAWQQTYPPPEETRQPESYTYPEITEYYPPLMIVPESTGYAVGAFSEGSIQANNSTRADVLPFMLNDPAPDFTLQATSGDFHSLSSYRGSNVIITFWISWKEGCLSSLSALRSVQRGYPDFAVLAVNSLPAENNNAAWTQEAFLGHIDWINSYFGENGFGFSALLDVNGQASSAFRADQLPVTYFIDRDGIIRISWPGALTPDTLDTLLGMMAALDRF
jgi:peroxiredoxin